MRPFQKHPYNREQPASHFSVDLTPPERDLLLDMLERDKKPTIRAREYIVRKIRDARRSDGPPLPVASLDFKRAEKAARERGESLAEWIYDGAPEPPEAA